MCSDHVHIRRLAQVNYNTLIVFIAPNRLCDYETLLHQKAHNCIIIYYFLLQHGINQCMLMNFYNGYMVPKVIFHH